MSSPTNAKTGTPVAARLGDVMRVAVGVPTPPHEMQFKALAYARMFEPKKVVGFEKIRVGKDNDGGYILIDDFTEVDAAFSFGIENDASWDLAIAGRNIPVHQFDFTVDRSPAEHPLLKFHKLRVAEANYPGCASLDTLVDRLLASARRAILKIDIETDEWPVFAAASLDRLAKFSQIACEFHARDLGRDPQWFDAACAVLAKLKMMFEVVHVHGNNIKSFVNVANVMLPPALEVTFANRRFYQFAETNEVFPTPLDQPNLPQVPDLRLGAFRF